MGRPRTDIQPRILRAARARFLADGVDGASLRTIAKEAGTSIGMVFYYYPTKDDLFLAVIEERYAQLVADLDVVLQQEAPLRERLRDAFLRLGRASEEELDIVRLVVREALVSSPRFQAVLARFRLGHIGMLLGALADGVTKGEIRAGFPLPFLLVTTVGIGAAPQIARRVAGDALPLAALPSAEELADMLVGVLFDGIGARASKAKANKKTNKQPKKKG